MRYLFFLTIVLCEHAPVVKWISQQSSELSFQVRVLAGALESGEVFVYHAPEADMV